MAEIEAVAGAEPFKLAKPPFGLVALLGAVTALPPLSIDMYLPSLPGIARTFGAPVSAAQATIAAFLVGLSLGQFFYGPISDRFGRRGPMIFGAALYFVGSAACALAPSLPFLIAARFVQALGGCAGQVLGRAVVRDRFDHRNAARVLSMLMLVWGAAPILAPLMGSGLTLIGDWRLPFWVLTGFGAVLTLWVVFGLKETRRREDAVLARDENPIRAYWILITNPRLVGYVLGMSCNSAATFAYVSAAPGLLESRYGVPASAFGWVFSINACALVAASQINSRLLRRYLPEEIVKFARLGTLAMAVLLAIMALTGVGGMYGVLVPLFFVIGSFGFFGANMTASALSVDPARAGSISSLMGGGNFAIGALASAAISASHDNGPVPMALTILAAVGASSLFLYTLAKPQSVRQGARA